MLPTISIITPTLNQAKYIEFTIESVLSQKYPCLEYLIIDGCSTDGTLEILKKYGGKIKWISEPDNCQVDAINKGINRVSGEIIGYLNSDDIYSPGALLKIGKYFQENPATMAITGKCHNINEFGRHTRPLVTNYKNLLLKTKRFDLLKIMNYVAQPATFWKRELHDQLGYFNPEYRYAMDYDFWLRIDQKYNIHFMDDYLASFRIYPTSITSSNSRRQFQEEYKIARQYSNLPQRILHKIHGGISYIVYVVLKIIKKKLQF